MSAASAAVTVEPPAREPRVALVLPVIVLASASLAWDSSCGIKDIPPYVLPAPVRHLPDAGHGLAGAVASLLVTLLTTLRALLAAASAASRWRFCSTSRGWSNIRSTPTR